MIRKLLIAALFIYPCFSFAQLVVDNTTNTPAWLVQNVLAGSGVTVSNVTFNGLPANSVTEQVGYFDGTSSNIGIPQGIIIATGDAQVAVGPNNNGGAYAGGPGTSGTDPDLQAICNAGVWDQAVLEFDFIPVGDTIKFNFVFGSEEYLEYVNAGFNDAFGFFLSGPGIAGPYQNGAVNLAVVPGTAIPVTIDNVNNVSNPAYYFNNEVPPGVTVQYDGFTVVMEAKSAVQCGQTYHIKLAICDAGDNILDSGVFLEANSFSSDGVDVSVSTVTGDTTIIEGCTSDAIFYFTRPDTSGFLTVGISIAGDAINGTDYTFIPDSVSFQPGEDTVILQVSPFADTLSEGIDTLILTVYTLTACGDTIPETATLLIIDPTPVFADAGTDQTTLCPGDPVTLNGNATGGLTPYDYYWDPPSSTSQNVNVSPAVTTQYVLMVTDLCGLTGFDTVVVNVPVQNPLVIITSDTSVLCPGDNATLTVQVSGGGITPYSYLWSNGDTDTTTSVAPLTTTGYTFTVTDNCGMDSTVSVNVTVPVYNLQVSTSDAQECMDEPVALTATANGGAGGYTFGWSGTGTFNTNASTGSTTITGAVTGLYIVTVIDQCGNTDSDTSDVIMLPCEILIPNVFSPNGDGANDVFYIDNIEYHPNSMLIIYNRWGQVVYESSNYTNNWNGGGVPDGVYYYILKKTDPDAKEYSGNVTILGSK